MARTRRRQPLWKLDLRTPPCNDLVDSFSYFSSSKPNSNPKALTWRPASPQMPFVQHLFQDWLKHSPPNKLKNGWRRIIKQESLQWDSYAFNVHLKSPRGGQSLRCLQGLLGHGCFFHGGDWSSECFGKCNLVIPPSLPAPKPTMGFIWKAGVQFHVCHVNRPPVPKPPSPRHSKATGGFSLHSS